MGRFTYDSTLEVVFDDRVLAHLQMAIGVKLRRGESFHFSWDHGRGDGGGRTTVWINPSVPITYQFSGSKQPTINRRWVEELVQAANSSGGMIIVPEPVNGERNGEG